MLLVERFVWISVAMTFALFAFSIHSQQSDLKTNSFTFEEADCRERAILFFNRFNARYYDGGKLDYSFAINDSKLIPLLGSDYKYISSVDSNCYAIVKNNNPLTGEYRYSILSVDIEVLDPVLLDHNFGNDPMNIMYQNQFVKQYSNLFK